MNNNLDILGVGITIGTGTSNLNTVAKHLELAESQNLEFVELSIFDWNVICGRKIIQSELNKICSLFQGSRLKFTVHGELSVNFFDVENIHYHKEVLKRDIEISSAIGALHLITHFGTTSEEIYKDKKKFDNLLKTQRQAYREMGEYAKDHNIILAVENLFSFFKNHYAPLPSMVADELNLINHPYIKGTLDFSHAYINCTQSNANFIEEIKKWHQYLNIFMFTIRTEYQETIFGHITIQKNCHTA